MPKKTSQKRRIRFVRSLKDLSEDEAFTMRDVEARHRTYPGGREETTFKITFYSESDSEKLLKFRNALKAAGRWPLNGGGAVR